MLTHKDVWAAIDALAARYKMSASGLARAAGLDPTTFNRSKRVAENGKLRWPSTESLAKILAATGASLPEFLELPGPSGDRQSVPVLRLDNNLTAGAFDGSGTPLIGHRTALFDDRGLYGLQIVDDRFAPIYRAGDRLLISPAAELRQGDRVAWLSHDRHLDLAVLDRLTGDRAVLRTLSGTDEFAPARAELVLLHRIVWASQ
jgi:phage repressor protein C with HTH and peptisase S24 domain